MATTDVNTCDYLDQDPEIRGQKFVCLSFISPEEVIARKEVVFFNKFLKAISDDLTMMFTNIQASCKDNIGNEKSQIVVDMIDSVKQRHDYMFNAGNLGEEYEFFKKENSEKLEADYLEANAFQTTIRGIKVRGTYDTFAEAQVRGEAIKKFDKNFNVFVAQVGCWCPWSPNPEHIEQVEYSETQLNTLMQKYKESQDTKNVEFRMRRDDMITKVEQLNMENVAANAVTAAAAGATAVAVGNESGIFVLDDVPTASASAVAVVEM